MFYEVVTIQNVSSEPTKKICSPCQKNDISVPLFLQCLPQTKISISKMSNMIRTKDQRQLKNLFNNFSN